MNESAHSADCESPRADARESILDKPVITDLSLLAFNDTMKKSPLPEPTNLEVDGESVNFLLTRGELRSILENKDFPDDQPIMGRVKENGKDVGKTFKLGEVRKASRDHIEDTFNQIQHY